MTLPLPVDYANSTVSADTHPAAHNNTNTVVNALDARLDALEAGGGATLPHKVTHQDGGTDELALDASQITTGTLNAARVPAPANDGHSHTGATISALDASDTTSGVFGTARLAATGTPSATTFLRGDQTWSTPAAGGSDTQTVETAAGTAYTVVTADSAKIKRLTGTATITLPSAGPTAGQRVDFVCVGGPATFVLGGGATWDVNPSPSAVARAIGSWVTAVKMTATAWALTGDLA